MKIASVLGFLSLGITSTGREKVTTGEVVYPARSLAEKNEVTKLPVTALNLK